MLVEEDATVLLSDELGEGPFHLLRDNFVSTYPVEAGSSVRDALDQYMQNELSLRLDGGKNDEKKV
jgi:predicted Fe-Mo cluster-binding NifX family protein